MKPNRRDGKISAGSSAAGGPAAPAAPADDMRDQSRQQDDLSVRAKNSGHGKKTADKWNQ